MINKEDAPMASGDRKSFSMAQLEQSAQCVGFLMKYEKGFLKALFGKSWKRKYCILSGYHFYYFKDKNGTGGEKSNGVVNLRYYDRCALPFDKHASVPNAFALSSSQKSDKHFLLFQAESPEEQQKWMTDIQLVIFQCQTQGRTDDVARPRSQPTTPMLRRNSSQNQRALSTTSIPITEQQAEEPERPISETSHKSPTEQLDSGIESPPHRPDSRRDKADPLHAPRTPGYNQVVNELQTKLMARRSSEPDEHTSSPEAERKVHSPQKFPVIEGGYFFPNHAADNSRSVSVSSYDNQDDSSERRMPNESLPTSPTSTNSGTNEFLDAQFENALRMLEVSHEKNAEEEYPFSKHPPKVLPKPSKELYETLLITSTMAAGISSS